MSYAIFVTTRAFDSKRDVYIAFVDSIMEFGTCAFLQYTKRSFLYSTTKVQLTMDYLPKVLKDSVVDSPLSCSAISIVVNLPFLLQNKAKA